jgi:hypothetical protein
VFRQNTLFARLLLTVWVAFAFAGVCSRGARASFKVYPTVVDVARPAGAAALGTIDVELKGEGKQRFRTIVEDVAQRPDGTLVYSPASTSPFSAAAWVRVTPASFEGAPDRVQPIRYQVALPPNAEPGDHLASLTVQRLGSGAGTARAIEAVSVRLTIRVRGRLRREAAITALQAPAVADGGPVSVIAVVRNAGNVTLDFDGANRAGVTIRDGDELEAALTPWSGQLFPGQTREFVSRWEDPPLVGGFDARAAVRIGKQGVSREEGFWVVPWREIGAVLLLVAAAALFFRGWRRRRWGY